MNAKQRRIGRRAAARKIEAYCRNECIRLGLDPEEWGTVTLNFGPVQQECRDRIRFATPKYPKEQK